MQLSTLLVMRNQGRPRLRFKDIAVEEKHEMERVTSISTDGGRVPTTYRSGGDLSNFAET